MRVRILATSPLVGTALERLGAQYPSLLVAPFRSAEWHQASVEAEALVVLLSEPLTESDLNQMPSLRAIATYSVGVNHLPLEACADRGIRILNTPDVLTDATADCALALLLAVTRRVAEGEALIRSGTWKGWAPDQLLGVGLAGKRCGILGAGAIGKAFAKRVWALGLEPVFWDREGSGGGVDFGPGQGRRLALPDLLESSSILSLHCPLTVATRGLLDREALARLPKGAVILNTARGGIMDEGAVLDLLDSGHLGGVGLDVYEGEPNLNPRWLSAPNTVLLPHLGSATRETREAMAECLCEGLSKVLSGTA